MKLQKAEIRNFRNHSASSLDFTDGINAIFGDNGEGKTNIVETISSIVGQFPAVILSPEQNGITFGAPTERRKFLDLAISQASKLYLDEVLEYRRILRQRNKILLDARLNRKDCTELLVPWDESLVRAGSSIM